jgi:hypothetical protein
VLPRAAITLRTSTLHDVRMRLSPKSLMEPKICLPRLTQRLLPLLALGAALAKDSRPMVYGGGSIGLMGAVAESVLENGGYVTGISPYAMTISGGDCLKEEEKGQLQQPYARLWVESHPNRENVVVDDMHTRKQLMALNATGGFVTLPGGYGTLEEVRGSSPFMQWILTLSENIGIGSSDLGPACNSRQAYVLP